MQSKNIQPKKIKKTVIIVGYKCNNKCIFCNDWNKRDLPQKTTRQIKREMIKAKGGGSSYLELIGGETTIRPDIIELLKFAKDLGFQTITMATNGRMYSFYNFAKKILESGLNSIIFSIHGHTPKLHDSLTQSPGSFEQLRKGLENVKQIARALDLKILIGSNTCLMKKNYKFAFQIGQYIRSLGIENSEFIFVDPSYGAAFNFFDEIVPKISDVSPFVYKLLDIGKKERILHWHVRYVPLCYFQNYLNQVSELQEIYTFHTEHYAPDFYNPDAEKGRQEISRIKPKKCLNCKLYYWCEGVWKVYLKHYGDKELKPVKRLTKSQLEILNFYKPLK